MKEQAIIEALIAHDEFVTKEFFFRKCRPLFMSIIHNVFPYEVDFDEFVNELYIHLMENSAYRLKQYQGRSSIYQWIKIVAIRFFISKRNEMIDNVSKEPLLDIEKDDITVEYENPIITKLQVEQLLGMMSNNRYAFIIRRLILEEAEPEAVAKELNTNVNNVYNIKKRALTSLTNIVLKETENYEKGFKQ